MSRGVFVAGTDTGVGKTCVAVALLRALGAAGVRAVGMKPVAAGLDPGAALADDVVRLRAAAGVDAPLEAVNPYAFAPPIAPHLAARAANVAIDLARIRDAHAELARRAQVVIVEGAGGVLVPLSAQDDMLDIPRVLGLPVLLVVGLRLGCLNHALLSAMAVRARGLVLAGFVVNRIDPGMDAIEGNVATLCERLGAPMLADLPWGAEVPRLPAAALVSLGLVPLVPRRD